MTTHQDTPQISLPGQAHVAHGPHDQTGMYLMHHAFRRDLDRFVRAVRGTPVAEAGTWRALADRWERFATTLHHHHRAEDEAMWPVLLEHARADGDEAAEATLLAMEAEHDAIDPELAACAEALTRMERHPCDEHRDALAERMTAVRALLAAHLAHEETDALPYLQRTMSAEEYAACERAAGAGYPLSMVPFLVPWVVHDLPGDAGRTFIAAQGRVYALLYRLNRRRFERAERQAFRFA